MELAEIKVTYTNSINRKIKIGASKDCYSLFKENWDKGIIELQEEFKVMLLNRANNILGIYSLSKGGTSGTIVDTKLLFSVALKCNSSSIIIAHNHPSGNLKPSNADLELTKKLKEAGKLLDVSVLDHLIITKDGYLSFADEGLI